MSHPEYTRQKKLNENMMQANKTVSSSFWIKGSQTLLIIKEF